MHELAGREVTPLPASRDPRFFGMSGARSTRFVLYDFDPGTASPATQEPLAPTTQGAVSASAFSAVGTDATGGPAGNGFIPEQHDPAGHPLTDLHIAHSGFADRSSYYTFVATPLDAGVDLYFLSLCGSHGGTRGHEQVVVTCAVGPDPAEADFVEVGRTTVPGREAGPTGRDIPLLLCDPLQGLTDPVTFRIYGWDFDKPGRSFRLDHVGLYGVARPEATP